MEVAEEARKKVEETFTKFKAEIAAEPRNAFIKFLLKRSWEFSDSSI